jgi:soluble lytic murein transglycosylase-like protein
MTLNKTIALITITAIICIILGAMAPKYLSPPAVKKEIAYMNKYLYYYMKIQDKLIVDNVMINARVRNIPESLVFSIIKRDSFFDPNAINTKNLNGTIDYGLMQLNSRTFKHLTERELMNISSNVYNGCELLEKLYKVYNGNLVKIIMAYNCGEPAVNKGQIPQITLNYLNDVLKYKAIYEIEIMKMELKNERNL